MGWVLFIAWYVLVSWMLCDLRSRVRKLEEDNDWGDYLGGSR